MMQKRIKSRIARREARFRWMCYQDNCEMKIEGDGIVKYIVHELSLQRQQTPHLDQQQAAFGFLGQVAQ